MVIKELIEDLKTASKPIARTYRKSDELVITFIGFKKGMVLASHKTNKPARLLVLSGNVFYKENERNIAMNLYDEVEIPADLLHEVEALSDSICMLTR
jgi:quercetin dioxygenase-like cupin family protein